MIGLPGPLVEHVVPTPSAVDSPHVSHVIESIELAHIPSDIAAGRSVPYPTALGPISEPSTTVGASVTDPSTAFDALSPRCEGCASAHPASSSAITNPVSAIRLPT